MRLGFEPKILFERYLHYHFYDIFYIFYLQASVFKRSGCHFRPAVLLHIFSLIAVNSGRIMMQKLIIITFHLIDINSKTVIPADKYVLSAALPEHLFEFRNTLPTFSKVF